MFTLIDTSVSPEFRFFLNSEPAGTDGPFLSSAGGARCPSCRKLLLWRVAGVRPQDGGSSALAPGTISFEESRLATGRRRVRITHLPSSSPTRLSGAWQGSGSPTPNDALGDLPTAVFRVWGPCAPYEICNSRMG